MLETIIGSIVGAFFSEAFKQAFKNYFAKSTQSKARLDESDPKIKEYREFIKPKITKALTPKIFSIFKEIEKRGASKKSSVVPILNKFLKKDIKSIQMNIGETIEQVNIEEVSRLISLYLERIAKSFANTKLLIDKNFLQPKILDAMTKKQDILFDELEKIDAKNFEEVYQVFHKILQEDIPKLNKETKDTFSELSKDEIQLVIETLLRQISLYHIQKQYTESRKFIKSKISQLITQKLVLITNESRLSGILCGEKIFEILKDILKSDIEVIKKETNEKFKKINTKEISVFIDYTLAEYADLIVGMELTEFHYYVRSKIMCTITKKIESITKNQKFGADNIDKSIDYLHEYLKDDIEIIKNDIEKTFDDLEPSDILSSIDIVLMQQALILTLGYCSITTLDQSLNRRNEFEKDNKKE